MPTSTTLLALATPMRLTKSRIAAGGTPRRLTFDGAREGSYSPDGTRVVYVRGFNPIYQDNYEGSANYDIYVLDVKGGTPLRLTDTGGNERWPFFSGDGRRIFPLQIVAELAEGDELGVLDGLAQRLLILGAEQRVLVAIQDHGRRRDRRGQPAILGEVKLLQHRAPDARRNGAGLAPRMGDESRVDRHRVGGPLADENGVLIDGVAQGLDVVRQPGSGRRRLGRGQCGTDEHQFAQAVGMALGEDLADHAAEGMADEIHLGDLQVIEQQAQIMDHVGNRVAAFRRR